MARMKILIIGGSGHVSGAVARAALAGKASVWAVTRGRRPVAAGVQLLVADRHDHAALQAAVMAPGVVWDLVVDCICYDLPDMLQDIELFRERASQFVLVSTDFVYDPARRSFPQPEESAHWAAGKAGSLDYGRKKRLCEQALMEGDTGAMAWTILRPCHIYGPASELGCLPLHARDPELCAKLRAGAPLQLVGGGHFLQQPLLADDLAATIISTAGNRQACRQVFNVAGPDMVESWRYYQIIAEALGVGLTVEEVPVRSYLDQHPEMLPYICHRIADLGRIKASGLSLPATPLEKGLRLHLDGLLARKGQK